MLFGQGKRQLQVDEESWKNPSEKKLRQWLNRLKTPMQPVRLARQPGPYPRTWAVETNEERIALVQIVNFEERIETELSGRVPGYIVRYRLLSEQVASDQDDANEKSEANEWGEVIDGVQARLIPKKLVWPEGSPPEFDIEVRTLPTAKNYTLPRVVMQLDVEIDGKWNSWRGRRLIAGYFGRSGDGESISEPYRPFHQPLILDANWGRDWELTRQAQNKLEISDKDFVAKHPVLNALMPGKHTVRVKIIGELVTQPVEIEVVTNTERGTTPITISGRALDIEDKPIRGATVYLASVPPMIFPSPKQSEPRLVAQTTTDGEGNYRFENTPFPVGENDMMGGGRITGKFQVFAVSAGKAMAWHPVREFDPNWPTTKGKHHHGYGRDDTIEIDLTLRQPVSIRGRVIDEDGQPIAGTQLALVHADTDWKIEQFLRNLDRQEHVLAASDPFYALFWPDVVPEELALRVTDKTGAFEFTRLPRDCRLHLRVKPPGYKPLSAWVLTEPSDPTLRIRNDAQRNIFGNDFTLVVDRDTAESEAAKADLEEEVNRRSYVQLSPASAALLKQLQGTWQVETQSSDGNESMIAHVEGEQIRLCKPNGEDPMTFDFGLIGGKPYHRIKLTPKISAAQRQAILAEIEFDPELAPLVLASNGFPGIIEASDDGFRICVCGEPGGERPMLFTVNKSQGLWILKRPVNSEPEANSEKVNDSATLKIKSLSDESGSDAEIFID